jgi:hypothetical protein
MMILKLSYEFGFPFFIPMSFESDPLRSVQEERFGSVYCWLDVPIQPPFFPSIKP